MLKNVAGKPILHGLFLKFTDKNFIKTAKHKIYSKINQ